MCHKGLIWRNCRRNWETLPTSNQIHPGNGCGYDGLLAGPYSTPDSARPTQDTVSWVIGFGIPTVLMLCSIVLFFIGTNIYVHVKPEGSIFSGIAQVFVAAYTKRKLKLPDDEALEVDGVFYDPPLKETVLSKLPLTNNFRLLYYQTY